MTTLLKKICCLIAFLPFCVVSCNQEKQTQEKPFNVDDYYADDIYFTIDASSNNALCIDYYHTINIQSLTHKYLVATKLSFNFSEGIEYELIPKHPEKPNMAMPELIYFLKIKNSVENVDININYFDTSYSQSFACENNALNSRVIFCTSYFIDISDYENALIVNSVNEYRNLGPVDINAYHIDDNFFATYTLVVGSVLLAGEDYNCECCGLYINDDVILQSTLLRPDNEDISWGGCKTFYVITDKITNYEAKINRIIIYV